MERPYRVCDSFAAQYLCSLLAAVATIAGVLSKTSPSTFLHHRVATVESRLLLSRRAGSLSLSRLDSPLLPLPEHLYNASLFGPFPLPPYLALHATTRLLPLPCTTCKHACTHTLDIARSGRGSCLFSLHCSSFSALPLRLYLFSPSLSCRAPCQPPRTAVLYRLYVALLSSQSLSVFVLANALSLCHSLGFVSMRVAFFSHSVLRDL